MAKKKGTGNNGQLSLFGGSTTQQLNNQLADIERKIAALYGSTYKFAAQLSQVKAAVNSGQEFTWQENPAAAKAIEQRLNAVAATLDGQLSKATERTFALGQASTEHALTKALGKDKATKKEVEDINADAAAEMRRRGADGHTYYTQARGGVTVSDRVWKMTESTKLEIEIAIQQAALEGKSADDLAKTIQQYLEHPERLFRSVRVIDPVTGEWTGEYRMSKAAQQCHPGQGVYRSAYKNALRLARTELTQAYRRAEWETYQDNPLITGYRIELSNNHTTTVVTKKGRKVVPLHDICDEMAGTQYPKTFLWTGWHPQCRCRMVPIIISTNDFKERIKARHRGKLDEWKQKEQTTEMPAAFTKWVDENKKRWQQPGHAAPYFIRDNYQQGNVAKGLDTRITAELEQARLAMEAAKAKEPPTPQPITDYDTEVMELRSIAAKYDIDLGGMERVRAEGEDKKALRKEINIRQRLWHKREANWQTAYNDARAQLTGLMGLLATYRSQENTREFWNLRDDIVPNYNTEIESYDPAYGASYNDAVKSLKSIKKKLEGLYYKFEVIFNAGAKGTTTPSGVMMRTEYNTDSDVDSTFKEINAKMSKGSRWFENGDLRLELETDPGNNGSTYMNGRLLLTQDIKDKVMSALGKIGKGESANITREEAQAIGTFWHEITHNRHITTTDRGNAGKTGSTTVKEMELANEWVARHTLDEFYSTLGVKKTPYPEFMTNRDNTGYNSMVTNYDYAIDKLGLDRTKALATVKQYLFNGNYITQAEGLKNGLLDAGIKKADGSTPTAREMTSLLVKIRDLEGKTEWDDTKKCWVKKTKEQLLDEWLQDHGFIKP
jgi:hypothetical protein